MSNSSIWPIDRTLSSATTLGKNGLGSNRNEGVLHIPQISNSGTSPSDCLMSYSGHALGESYSSVEMQLGYSTAPADWAENMLEKYRQTHNSCFPMDTPMLFNQNNLNTEGCLEDFSGVMVDKDG